jgi:hypothetical protein
VIVLAAEPPELSVGSSLRGAHGRDLSRVLRAGQGLFPPRFSYCLTGVEGRIVAWLLLTVFWQTVAPIFTHGYFLLMSEMK